MNPVHDAISRKLGQYFGKNYVESESFFGGKIETNLRRDYFIESIQFISSTGEKSPREYKLKCIKESNIDTVISFGSKYKSDKFWDNLEFTKSGSLIVERSLLSREQFDNMMKNKLVKRLYDDGLTACYADVYDRRLYSYCEGDIVEMHSASSDIFRAEKDAHLRYFKEC